jgi:hypothetical protein
VYCVIVLFLVIQKTKEHNNCDMLVILVISTNVPIAVHLRAEDGEAHTNTGSLSSPVSLPLLAGA